TNAKPTRISTPCSRKMLRSLVNPWTRYAWSATSVVATSSNALAAWSDQTPIATWMMRFTNWPRFHLGHTMVISSATAAAMASQPMTFSQNDSVLICSSASMVNGIRLSSADPGVPGICDMMTSPSGHGRAPGRQADHRRDAYQHRGHVEQDAELQVGVE